MQAWAIQLKLQGVMELSYISTSRIHRYNSVHMSSTGTEGQEMAGIAGSILTSLLPVYLPTRLITTTDRIFCTAVLGIMRCSGGWMPIRPVARYRQSYPFRNSQEQRQH